MKINEEAIWSIQEIKKSKLISEEDTAIIFQSWSQLEYNLNHLNKAFEKYNALHCIAIKTNPHPGVLKKIVDLGFGLEAASMEEIELAFSVGIDASKLVFDSPVKTQNEINRCQEEYKGIIVNANSLEELDRIPLNPNFKLGLRINPRTSSNAPELYNVSDKESKFGVSIDQEEKILNAILKFPITLLHMHIGSSLSSIDSSTDAICQVYALINKANSLLLEKGIKRQIDAFDIGGGLKPELLNEIEDSLMQKYAGLIDTKIPQLKNLKLITEFGQWVHFHAGYCWSKVEYVQRRGNKQILFIHLGADFFMRDAYTVSRGMKFQLIPHDELSSQNSIKTDIAGPLCFAGDYVVRDIDFLETNEGDELLIYNTGSNAYALWSRHCSRKIPKVIAVDINRKSIEILSKRTSINF